MFFPQKPKVELEEITSTQGLADEEGDNGEERERGEGGGGEGGG